MYRIWYAQEIMNRNSKLMQIYEVSTRATGSVLDQGIYRGKAKSMVRILVKGFLRGAAEPYRNASYGTGLIPSETFVVSHMSYRLLNALGVRNEEHQ